MGIEMNETKVVPVVATTVKLHMKVCDRFAGALYDQDGNQIGHDYEGYVPGFMPGQHYGDYLILNIDLETGRITNWVKPTATYLEEAFLGNEED